MAWSRFKWLMVQKRGGFCKHGSYALTFVFVELLASTGLSSTDMVSYLRCTMLVKILNAATLDNAVLKRLY